MLRIHDLSGRLRACDYLPQSELDFGLNVVYSGILDGELTKEHWQLTSK